MCIVYSDLNDERTTTHMHLSRIFGHLHKAYTVCSSSMRFHAGMYALINAHYPKGICAYEKTLFWTPKVSSR